MYDWNILSHVVHGGLSEAVALIFFQIIFFCSIQSRLITLDPLREKHGVPQERTWCVVGARERDHQLDPGTAPKSTWPPKRRVPDSPQWPKWRKCALSLFFVKILENSCSQSTFWPSGLSGHQKRGQGQKCHGVAHERHQNAQNWAALWAPPTILKSKGK